VTSKSFHTLVEIVLTGCFMNYSTNMYLVLIVMIMTGTLPFLGGHLLLLYGGQLSAALEMSVIISNRTDSVRNLKFVF